MLPLWRPRPVALSVNTLNVSRALSGRAISQKAQVKCPHIAGKRQSKALWRAFLAKTCGERHAIPPRMSRQRQSKMMQQGVGAINANALFNIYTPCKIAAHEFLEVPLGLMAQRSHSSLLCAARFRGVL
ncbi:MAG: hypothetical protein Ta2B_12090 [Termitinemataceae bacterium]|nr:MAG: hypothetical protein Ta2B_12090 [Termitinemataceae bacterium]